MASWVFSTLRGEGCFQGLGGAWSALAGPFGLLERSEGPGFEFGDEMVLSSGC
ncbi:MAG: hypothetical protein M0008_08775 [Actinomycetota bacterium]|nr:hypothetical protein [Actinomycetota bacterium]